MASLRSSAYFIGTYWSGWRRWAAWSVCAGAILLLGAFRLQTDAQYAIASLALLPVLSIAWIGGKWDGLLMAFLAAAMWLAGDIASAKPYSSAWIPWANAATRLMTYSLVALLAAQVRLQFEREYENATRDALTGLLNRRAFVQAGASEAERAKRYLRPLTVAFLDLDDFKRLNDTKGHDAGDAALRAAARALQGTLRASDRVARLGGDEFGVLLPEIGYSAAGEAGRKMSVAVNRALEDFPPVSASIGMAWFAEMDRTFPEMLTAADELMYQVKQSGKRDMRARQFTAMRKPDSES